MKLSIIVPVYNAEKWLRRCVVSLLNQDIDKSEYEILLIDDGSKDGSLAIAHQLATEASNIRVFTQPNAGPGAARNRGIDNATGDYLMFVDADDDLKPNSLNEVLTMSIKNNCDLCFYKLRVYYDTFGHYYISGCNLFDGIITGEEAIISGYTKFGSACTSIFNKQLIINANISFSKLQFGEDSLFMAQTLSLSKRVMVSGIELYNYEFSKTPNKSERARIEELKLIDSIHLAKGIQEITFSLNISSTLKWHLKKHTNSIVTAQILKFARSYTRISQSTKQKFINNLFDSRLIPLKGPTLSWKTTLIVPICNFFLFLFKYNNASFHNK